MAFRRNRQAGTLGGLILGGVLLVIGYFVAFSFGKPIVDKAKASERWPTVEGRITTSEVQQDRGNKGKVMFSANVGYDYQVDGQKLLGDTVWFGGNFSSSSSGLARQTVDKYPVGKQVRVSYDPAQPEVSVLEPGAFWSSYLVYGIGLLLLGIGLLIVGSLAVKLLFVTLVVGGVVGSRLVQGGSASANQFAVPQQRPVARPGPEEGDDGIRID
ncbi:MAG: DUF3592 domain-containing protein [Alphaproteobacteria bacterium]|nr:DUF3592 domain-containing protein [Alphaproteobacteria bacterium]